MRSKAVSRLMAMVGIGAVSAAAFALTAAGEPPAKPAPPLPAPLAHGPIATYDAGCARCHGPNGSFYGPTLGKGKTDAQLRQVIKEMAEGPAQLPALPPAELEAQTAYHRAIIKAEPFLAVTVRTPTRIEGKVTSGATVGVSTGGKATAVKTDGSHWSASLTAKEAPPIVTARMGRMTTMLDTAKAAFSHAAPLTESTQSTTGQTTK